MQQTKSKERFFNEDKAISYWHCRRFEPPDGTFECDGSTA
jgi:hypothetical protein